MKNRGLNRIMTIVGVCAVAGALAGIAGSAAAPSKTKSSASASKAKSKASTRAAHRAGRRGPGGPGFRMGLGGGPPVHSEAVVPNEAGTGFDTVTMDSGNLESIDGNELTIKEGTDKATYKTVKIDVGSDAKVVRNHEDAKLSDLKADDNVHVVQGPKGNLVMAESDAFQAQERKEHEGRRHFRPGSAPPPDGPPPTGA